MQGECGVIPGYTVTGLRPGVAYFAQAMEGRMAEFDGVKTLDGMAPVDLLDRLMANASAAAEALEHGNVVKARQCMVDSGNFAMLLWGQLPKPVRGVSFDRVLPHA